MNADTACQEKRRRKGDLKTGRNVKDYGKESPPQTPALELLLVNGLTLSPNKHLIEVLN